MKSKPGMILRADGQRNGGRVSGFVYHSAGIPDGWTATVDRLPGLSLMKRMAGDASGVILYRPYFRRSSARVQGSPGVARFPRVGRHASEAPASLTI
jgi:hypothetical protein